MKKITIAVAIVIAITLIVSLTSVFFGTKTIEEYKGKTLPIRWEEVNVRQGHSMNENVISSLQKGRTVILTGVRYDDALVLDDVPWKSWTQVRLSDGTLGWIVTEAIQWH